MRTKKNLLLIEDNPLLIELYKSAFEKVGFSVSTATEGEKGFEMAKKNSPNIIVLDLLILGMSGFDTLKKLTTDTNTKNIKIVILTAINDQRDKDKAKKLGAVDYLVKSHLKIHDVASIVMDHCKN